MSCTSYIPKLHRQKSSLALPILEYQYVSISIRTIREILVETITCSQETLRYLRSTTGRPARPHQPRAGTPPCVLHEFGSCRWSKRCARRLWSETGTWQNRTWQGMVGMRMTTMKGESWLMNDDLWMVNDEWWLMMTMLMMILTFIDPDVYLRNEFEHFEHCFGDDDGDDGDPSHGNWMGTHGIISRLMRKLCAFCHSFSLPL